jgi:hypothetical protein
MSSMPRRSGYRRLVQTCAIDHITKLCASYSRCVASLAETGASTWRCFATNCSKLLRTRLPPPSRLAMQRSLQYRRTAEKKFVYLRSIATSRRCLTLGYLANVHTNEHSAGCTESSKIAPLPWSSNYCSPGPSIVFATDKKKDHCSSTHQNPWPAPCRSHHQQSRQSGKPLAIRLGGRTRNATDTTFASTVPSIVTSSIMDRDGGTEVSNWLGCASVDRGRMGRTLSSRRRTTCWNQR